MAISGGIRGIKSGAATRALVKETLELSPSSERSALKRVFKAAAGADSNKHLSLSEAMLVRDAWDATPDEGFSAETVNTSVQDQLQSLAAAQDPDGIKTYFTSTTKNMGELIVQGFKDVIAEADGKPCEFNAMIFAFTDKKIANAILDLAEAHPNATFRLVTDFAQLSKSGGRQASVIHDEASKRGLDNVQVKFKRDGAYTWNDSLQRPVYHHGSTKGLNHHKGYVALIAGKPVRLFTGSFNWSQTAANKNFENLFVVDSNNPANRRLIPSYQGEFTSFFNHKDALNKDQARAWKRDLFNGMRQANGLPAQGAPIASSPTATYVPLTPAASFDVNHLTDANYDKLKAQVGPSVAKSIVYSYGTYGPFRSFAELLERVPKVATLSETKQQGLEARLDFGEGSVLINSASASELARSLKITKKLATKIIAKRMQLGDFESVDQLKGLAGLSSAIYNRIAPRINDDIGRAYYSARGYDDSKASTGWAAENAAKMVPVMGADGEVEIKAATLSAGVIDLVRRAKSGDDLKIAMYGMSANTPEYAEIVDAAARGVKVQVVLNKAYNAGVASALQALSDSGLPIQVRIMKSKTMHEKFGVVNDDVFQGSSNFSSSSSSKHTEDRFVVKNNVQLAGEFDAEFERLWTKAKPLSA